jgi:hypothetical protein
LRGPATAANARRGAVSVLPDLHINHSSLARHSDRASHGRYSTPLPDQLVAKAHASQRIDRRAVVSDVFETLDGTDIKIPHQLVLDWTP